MYVSRFRTIFLSSSLSSSSLSQMDLTIFLSGLLTIVLVQISMAMVRRLRTSAMLGSTLCIGFLRSWQCLACSLPLPVRFSYGFYKSVASIIRQQILLIHRPLSSLRHVYYQWILALASPSVLRRPQPVSTIHQPPSTLPNNRRRRITLQRS